ncbi:glycosyltransferase family 2 protein [Alteromonas halophila]|uniref:dTDP-rhamnosyl transferase RfbF n=1 Tax=Alteromonas halophila TaxID=516698 RepID=A0A918JBT3_9ALTE|nr:glycosyltransferase family 2 protein [Alteromonas halophila]GGW72844.1 dTDP-rhamnosyl transferase RfbF [Alteromonas halophila]
MNVAAVIILYYPDLAHCNALLTALQKANVPAVLVDNSPTSHKQAFSGAYHYLHFPDNAGIAKAQNEGLKYLCGQHFSHAVLLDQDSHLDGQMIARLSDHFQTLNKRQIRVAALGPSILCSFTDRPVQAKVQTPRPVSESLSEVSQLIASGMMIPLSVLPEIGLKEEGLFIDGVDHEWCWRARAKGYRVFQAVDVLMPHRQGDDRKRLLGIEFKIGAPIRLYYQARNVLLLVRRSYVPRYWKLRNLVALPIRYLVNRWYFPEGRKRGRYLMTGVKDGLKRKAGKFFD